MVKYRVEVEGRQFEIEIGPQGQVWVDRRPLNVDLEGGDAGAVPFYSLLVDGRSYEARLLENDTGETERDDCRVVVSGRSYRACLHFASQHAAAPPPPCPSERSAQVRAPLPGLLVEMRVKEGQQVAAGDVVAVLESMKMLNELRTPHAGLVRSLEGAAGQEVAQGQVLAVIEQEGNGDAASCL